jgi:hypothetical protein
MDTCTKKPPEGTFEPGSDKAFTRRVQGQEVFREVGC